MQWRQLTSDGINSNMMQLRGRNAEVFKLPRERLQAYRETHRFPNPSYPLIIAATNRTTEQMLDTTLARPTIAAHISIIGLQIVSYSVKHIQREDWQLSSGRGACGWGSGFST